MTMLMALSTNAQLSLGNVLNTLYDMEVFVKNRKLKKETLSHMENIQRMQLTPQEYQTIKTCLGRQWFQEHPSPLMRATRGFVFLNQMDLGQFYQRSMALKQAAENR